MRSTPRDRPTGPGQLVVVSGAGRSGTSTVAGALSKLGYHVPQPEVEPNRSNPRGFFESRWVVDFHTRMLALGDSTALDTRPDVGDTLRRIGSWDRHRDQLRDWLRDQPDDLLIKDPRTFWFLDLWYECAADRDAEVKFLSMLRHPAEVVGSRDEYYSGTKSKAERAAGEVANLAGWVNCSLLTERATRGRDRIFLRYTDLIGDWREALGRVADELSLDYDSDITKRRHPIDGFIDADLRRVRATWTDRAVPDWLRDIAEETWLLLSGENGSLQEDSVRADLDALHDRYARRFGEAIALSRDHTRAATRLARRQTRRKVTAEGAAEGAASSRTGSAGRPASAKPGPQPSAARTTSTTRRRRVWSAVPVPRFLTRTKH